MQFKNIFGRSYLVDNVITDGESTVNWVAEPSESEGATSKISFIPTPGVDALLMVDKVGYRCMWSMNGRTFGVVQDGFYEFTKAGSVWTATLRGTVALDNNPATISANGESAAQLFITSGGLGYNYDLSTDTLTTIAGLAATQGGFLGGYFLAFDKDTSRVRYSDLFDGTVWDPLNFFERNDQPDNWQAMAITSFNYICLPGQYTGQMWYANGGFPLPFQPDPSGNFNKGCAATFSMQNAGGVLRWLSSNVDGGYEVVAASGLVPQRVSDFGLEDQIASYARDSRIDDAVGQSFRQKGHTYYRLNFFAANKTWQQDSVTGWWNEVATWIAEDDEYTYFRPVFTCFAEDTTLAGDRESGTLYELDQRFFVDVDDRPIRRLRRTPAIVSQQQYVFHRKLTILMKVGVGTISGSGSDPKLMLRYSDDGGVTWSNETECSFGTLGAYDALVWFWQLGMARNRVYEISSTDPVFTGFSDGYLIADRSMEAA